MGARLLPLLGRERDLPVRNPLDAEFLKLNLLLRWKNLLRFLAPVMFHDDDVDPFAYEKGGKGDERVLASNLQSLC